VLAEALANERAPITVRRLRDVLLSFGAAGRAYADDLRTSANPTVRRAAIELLRAFGGADALPDLAALLDDAEPGVQRDALRAIVHIGTDEAYGTLEKALKSGTPQTRDAMMHVLASSRDERAVPLFVYILHHAQERGTLESVYLAAIEGLGKVGGDAESVGALKGVLYGGTWWAPWRTGRRREAAARALRATGSELANQALEEAANAGPRGTRRAARVALASPDPQASARRAT
jgi:HEAT repeat protein